MPPDAELDAHWRSVAAHPGDALPLLILADRLDEEGRGAEADCLRWAAETRRSPALLNGRYYWTKHPTQMPHTCHVGPVLLDRMLGQWYPGLKTCVWRQYRDVEAAYQDLARAWLAAAAAGEALPGGEPAAAKGDCR